MSFHRSFAFLLLGIISASGQEPADNAQPAPVTPPNARVPVVPPVVRRPQLPPGVPIPGAAQAPPAGAPAINEAPRQPGVPLGQTKIVGDINEQKLSGNALAGLYRKFTGRRVIVSSAAATAEFAFVQDATAQDPLTYAEAAELLKKAATIENFIFVPDEQDPNLDVLTLSSSGIRPTQRGVDVYNENSTLPEGDAVISYVMTLSYIKPAEAVNTFTQIIGQFGAYGSIAAVPNASAVVITENTSLIRKLIDLKKEIDKPGSVQGTRFIKVQYADVTEIATTLTELFTAQQSTQKTAGIQRTDNGAPGGNAGQLNGQPGGGSSGEESPVQIIPDPRTNRIFAMGRPVDLLFVEGLIREFDVETSEKNFLRRKLRFLTVADFLPVASDALTRAFTSTGSTGGAGAQGGAAGGAQGANRSQSNNRQNSSGNTRTSGGSTGANFGGSTSSSGGSSSFGGAGGSSSGGSSSGSSSALNDPNASSAPQSVLVGRTLLVADNITNSIVVQGPPSGLEIIGRLLDQIDVKPDQVMISTVIGQLTLDDSTKFGMDYLGLGGNVIGGGGGGLRNLIDIPSSGTEGTPGFVPAKKGGFDTTSLSGSGLRVYGKIGNNLSVYLEALQSKSDFTVLSRPSIFTSNNQKGTISSGERIAIPTSSNSFSTGGASTNIEYQDVVLKLEVIPLVNSDNEITMQLALLNDEQNGTQTIAGAGSNGTDLTVPKISTREILTTVTVPNNETIVLGGLIVGRNGKDKSGIPILSSIPYIGGLFGTTTDTKTRSELMVFIQPSVVNNDRSLNSVQADMDNRYKVSGKTRGMADGPGVLPPVDAIPPVADKESARHSASKTGTAVAQSASVSSSSTMKPSIRPSNRK